jgi:hypothetical protein
MKSPVRVAAVSARRVSALGLLILFAVLVTDGLAQYSPVRPAPPLPPPSGSVVSVSTVSALQSAVATLTSGTTILISPGVYRLTQELRIRNGVTNVALRGATNNRDDVMILGTGMNGPGSSSRAPSIRPVLMASTTASSSIRCSNTRASARRTGTRRGSTSTTAPGGSSGTTSSGTSMCRRRRLTSFGRRS